MSSICYDANMIKNIIKSIAVLILAAMWVLLGFSIAHALMELKEPVLNGFSNISIDTRRSIGYAFIWTAVLAIGVEYLQKICKSFFTIATLFPKKGKKTCEFFVKHKSWGRHILVASVFLFILVVSYKFPAIFRTFFVSNQIPGFESLSIQKQLELQSLYGNQFCSLASIFSGLAFAAVVMTLAYTMHTDKKRDKKWLNEQKRLVASEKRNEFYRRISLLKDLENRISIQTLDGIKKTGCDAACEFVNLHRAFMDGLQCDEKSRDYGELVKLYEALLYSHWGVRMWINTMVNIIKDIKHGSPEEKKFYLSFLINSTNHFSKLLLIIVTDPIGSESRTKEIVDELINEKFLQTDRYGWIVGGRQRTLLFNTLLCTRIENAEDLKSAVQKWEAAHPDWIKEEDALTTPPPAGIPPMVA